MTFESAQEYARRAFVSTRHPTLDDVTRAILNAAKGIEFQSKEDAAKRVETYAVSLEFQRHIGLPDPVEALQNAAKKIRK